MSRGPCFMLAFGSACAAVMGLASPGRSWVPCEVGTVAKYGDCTSKKDCRAPVTDANGVDSCPAGAAITPYPGNFDCGNGDAAGTRCINQEVQQPDGTYKQVTKDCYAERNCQLKYVPNPLVPGTEVPTCQPSNFANVVPQVLKVTKNCPGVRTMTHDEGL